jgi:hypothetical protein
MAKHFAILAEFWQSLIDKLLDERAAIGQDNIDGGSKICKEIYFHKHSSI